MTKIIKNLGTAFLACLFFMACNSSENKSPDPESKETKSEGQIPKAPDGTPIKVEKGGTDKFVEIEIKKDQNNLTGHYVGNFSPNKINLTISEVIDGKAFGWSTVSGNHRPLEGSITETPEGFDFNLKEPGDDQWDGVFEFFVEASGEKAIGNWTPYKQNEDPSRYKTKTFALEKREWKFDSTAGQFPKSSIEWIAPESLFNLTQEELRLMRSEIYARHGYSFKTKDMRAHFDAQDWYMPMSTDVRDEMSEKEWYNIQTIKEVEEYGEDWYDVFGR